MSCILLAGRSSALLSKFKLVLYCILGEGGETCVILEIRSVGQIKIW